MRLLAGAAGVLLTLAAPAHAGVLPAPPTIDQLPALEGPRFTIASAATGHRYHVFISLPEGYRSQPQARFASVYVLDGDSLFPVLAPTQRFLQNDDDLQDAIVIGIAYGSFDPPANRRRHDYTGEPDAFGRFLADELIPEVERRVRADPDRRILVGQSRGATYVLHDAWTQPDLFQARIASNPTLDHPRLERPPVAARRRDLSVFVASGEHDDPTFRARAQEAFARWRNLSWPWKMELTTMSGATHAADISRTYRWAMRQILPPSPPVSASQSPSTK